VVLESGAMVTDDAGNPLLPTDSVVAAANGSGATITLRAGECRDGRHLWLQLPDRRGRLL
jgi:hypothetical protein